MRWWPALSFFAAEACRSLVRQKGLTACAASAIALAFFVLGVVLVFLLNAGAAIENWKKAAPLTVFLTEGAGDGARKTVEESLGKDPAVESYRFVPRQEALADLEDEIGTLAEVVSALGGNPLPDGYVASLRPSAITSDGLAALASRLEELAGVDSVEYAASWMGRWRGAMQVLETLLYFVGCALGVAVVFIVAQTLRLKMYARVQEIEIMELVGATRRFIHGPFVVEGGMQGLIGSIAAFVVLCVSFYLLKAEVAQALPPNAAQWPMRFLSPAISLLFILAGGALGCLGSLVSMRYSAGARRR